MGRADHLEQTLPTWMLNPIDEIVVVDWSSPEGIKKIIDTYQDGRIIHVSVPGQTVFDRSRAKNTGVRISTGHFLILCDADVKLGAQATSCVKSRQSALYRKYGPRQGFYGTCLLTRNMFQQVNGYNERIEGWGYEDDDLFNRLASKYPIQFTFQALSHIEHTIERKTEFHLNKDSKKTRRINKRKTETEPWTSADIQKKTPVVITRLNHQSHEVII
jgi:glycosyltransferase involved in cell wall biosynthesis